MKTVGIRDLKNRLSEFLREVRAGDSVLVTDRGEVIAEIGAPGQATVDPSVPPGLAALAKRGLLTLASMGGVEYEYPRLRRRRRGSRAAHLLDEERGPR